MNILLVTETYSPFISGVSTSSESIADFMYSRGHSVTVLCPKPILPVSKKSLFPVVYAPSIPDPVYRGKSMTIFPCGLIPLIRLLPSKSFDLVHVQEPGSLGISALILSRILRIPVVGALHFTPDQITRMLPGNPEKLFTPFLRFFQRIYYNSCTGIMIPTQTFADYLRNIGVRKPMSVVSNGVNTELYHPPSANERKLALHGKKSGTVEFFYLGRLDKDKNVTAIINSLPKTDKSVRLLIAGDGKEKPALMALSERLGVADKITWFGNIDQSTILHLYHRTDAFILLALYEIQSIVTLQALACGLPVILANAGALPELVHDGKNGYLVDPRSYKEIAERINIIAQSSNLRSGMGTESRKLSILHHKPTVLKKLEHFYQEIITRISKTDFNH